MSLLKLIQPSGKPLVSFETVNEYGQIRIIPYDGSWVSWTINTTNYDDDGKKFDELSIALGGNFYTIEAAEEYANKILEACKIAREIYATIGGTDSPTAK